MATQVTEWAFKQVGTAELYCLLFLVNRQGCVLHQRMHQVGGHALVGIPIAGGILKTGEKERFQARLLS